jgi:hypothetical protein
MTPALIIRRVMQKRAELVENERVFTPSPSEKNLDPMVHTNLDEPPFPKPKEKVVKKLIQKVSNLVSINGPLISNPLGNTNNQDPLGPRQSTYSPEKSPFFALQGLGALYLGYLSTAKEAHSLGTINKFFKQAPWLVPVLMGAVAIGTSSYQKSSFDKQAAFDPFLMRKEHFIPRVVTTIPAAYVAAGHQENKLQKGKQITKMEDIVRKHPFLVGSAGLYASGHIMNSWPAIKNSIQKMASLDKVVYGLGPVQFDRLFADVIGEETIDIK